MSKKEIKARLEYLRGEIEAERISYGELAELQSLAKYIEPDDVQLREAAGLPEFTDKQVCQHKAIYKLTGNNEEYTVCAKCGKEITN